MLEISPSGWREACEVLGEQHAAITLAAIYQRADQIASAGGYLRSLTDRAREGKFSTWPMVMALLRVKLEAQKLRDADRQPTPIDAARSSSGLRASDALLRSLSKPRPR